MSGLSLTKHVQLAEATAPRQVDRPLVMIVDDHDDTREMLRYAIEMNGYRVIEAANGEQAVQLAEGSLPNLILMDTSLPEVDGYTATQRIRQVQGARQLTIIFLSGHAEPQSREMALAAGGDGYFVKPVRLEELELALKKHLTSSDSRI
jgi:CheY-like chemotaxis protein